MSKPICIVTETDWVPDDALDKMADVFELRTGPFSFSELENLAVQAAGYFVGLDHHLSAELLPPNIQFVASPTTGLNHIDLDHGAGQGLEVVSLKGEAEFLNDITATSELCWGLILSTTRKIPHAAASVKDNQWDRDRFIAHELKGSTIGIIGLGRLGRKVATYAKAFDMRVLACDNTPAQMSGVEIVSLEKLLGASDIITLHVDSRSENYQMIGVAEFNAMKDNAVFINTARGDLVDEAALLDALHSGKLSSAALDVLEAEHKKDCAASAALIEFAKDNENLLIVPHIGGVTYESQYKTTHFVVDKLLAWWGGTHG